MAPRLPSNDWHVSAAGTLTAMALVLVGGFLLLEFGLALASGYGGLGTQYPLQGAAGVVLAVVGGLVYEFVARRDVSPRAEDEESYSDPASTLLWGW
ncbi:hypothetical protein [Halosimplex sp. J119]